MFINRFNTKQQMHMIRHNNRMINVDEWVMFIQLFNIVLSNLPIFIQFTRAAKDTTLIMCTYGYKIHSRRCIIKML